MRRPSAAATAPLTWVLALGLLVALDVTLSCTSVLWGKAHASWVSGGLARGFIWQTYDVARKIYAPRRRAEERVAILGNSRAWFAARDAYVERALRAIAPELDVRVDNLAIFGARIGDSEILSRHLDRLHPTLVVLTLSGADLVPTAWGQLVNPTGELFDIGWADGPIPPASMSERVDRWLSTVSSLYRFRYFERALLRETLFPVAGDRDFPDHFDSPREFFEFSRTLRAPAVATAYERWREEGTLEAFVRFVRKSRGEMPATEPVPDPQTLSADSPGIAVLDRLLARLAAGPWKAFVLLMPENPLLAEDSEGLYHRPGFSARAAELVEEAAARHGVPVVDGRDWMPPQAFADFLHVLPDVSGFQKPLAVEIVDALSS